MKKLIVGGLVVLSAFPAWADTASQSIPIDKLDTSESAPLITDLLNYTSVAEQLIPTISEDITQVDPTLTRICLYNDRKRPETEKLAVLVENRIQELLLPMRRFKLIESRETKTTRILSSQSTLQVSNTIESLDRMRGIGKELGVDGIMMYSTFVTNKVALVHLKLVRAADGEITWSHRYAFDFDEIRQATLAKLKKEQYARTAEERAQQEFDRRNRDSGVYAHLGVTGLGARRTSLVPQLYPDHSQELSFNGGCLLLRNTGFWENLAVGLDLEYLHAGGNDDYIQYGLLNVFPILFVRLDPLFIKGDNMGVINFYAGPGQTFSFAESLTSPNSGKVGLLLRFTPDLFADLGATYIPKQSLKMGSKDFFQDTMTYGGLAYHASIGFAFK